MSHPTAADKRALRMAYMQDSIQTSITRRWGSVDWDMLFPWWREPAKIRILMYADGDICFSGENFGGLQYVRALLERHLYFYADFEIETAHRDGDPCDSESRPKKLTDFEDINKFDQIWFFGFETEPDLTPEEMALLDQFMGARKQGGILVTGDHGDRGRRIAEQITRAGKMRLYPAPPSESMGRNTTITLGADGDSLFEESDQYDDRAQKIRLTRFPLWTPLGFRRVFRPHPLMSGPDGPIDMFPDHKHEGEAVTPDKPSPAEWPEVNGHRELPVVIARGKITDPQSDKFGQEIGLVSAYEGHRANVGRIVADSSWHHWLGDNLVGLPGRVPPHPHAGFDATSEGATILKKLDAYFLNCATWLAPPNKQAEMRCAAWWSIVWSSQITELSIDAPIWHLGAEAIEALGLNASSGAALEWVLNVPAFREKVSNQSLPDITGQLQFISLPFEQYVAGGIISELMRQVGPANPDMRFPSEPQSDDAIERAINDGVKVGIDALTDQLSREVERLSEMVKNNFR